VVDALPMDARNHENGGRFAVAGETYRRAADMGSDADAVDYARTLVEERFGEEDREEAIRRLEQAAAKGSPIAMFQLGAYYRDGRVCERDIPKALDYYVRAAELRYIPACLRAAVLLMPNAAGSAPSGRPNAEKAIRLYEMAVEAGDESAMHNYAVVLSGQMGEQYADTKRAVELWKKAADKGIAAAQFRYGECAEKGIEMPADVGTACHYYRLAAEKNPKAKQALQRLQGATG
jgi:TPR repeat protein